MSENTLKCQIFILFLDMFTLYSNVYTCLKGYKYSRQSDQQSWAAIWCQQRCSVSALTYVWSKLTTYMWKTGFWLEIIRKMYGNTKFVQLNEEFISKSNSVSYLKTRIVWALKECYRFEQEDWKWIHIKVIKNALDFQFRSQSIKINRNKKEKNPEIL